MQVCFIGHRTIEKTDDLISSLKETILALIKKGVTTFLFGSMSEFDSLSWKVVSEIKEHYPFIKRVYIRSTYQYINKPYEKYLLDLYEEVYFPPKLENAGKYSYVERNYEMINKSTYCVFYYNKNYVPQLKRKSKQLLSSPSRNSGTKIAYDYAIRRKKEIINLYK